MTDIASMPTDELRRRLDLADNRYHRAAIGLLDFAGLLDRRDIRAHLDLDTTGDQAALWVNWRALGADTGLSAMGGTQLRLLRLAVSIACGIPVDLRESLSGLGHQHARAVLTAVAEAMDIGEDVQITDSPAYSARKRADDEAIAALLAGRGAE
ncbi:hypothetical protein [Nocardia sp. NPDC050435]|uniref:hypothetical protein n=1 Tax=Nocardia sp. NPDC050435 TaxID=3155040 RepID=UPI0033D44EF8